MRRVIGVASWGARSSSLPGYLRFSTSSVSCPPKRLTGAASPQLVSVKHAFKVLAFKGCKLNSPTGTKIPGDTTGS
eukprot:scaffold102892_cov53-Phaeocystis_antarctica.AAC.1